MFPILLLLIFAFVGLQVKAVPSSQPPTSHNRVNTITWDCLKTPNACENFCYTVNCKHDENLYTKVDSATTKRNRRKSGVSGRGSPCRQDRTSWAEYAKVAYPTIEVNADEWPPASAAEGGNGAWIRCMPTADNHGILIPLASDWGN